MVIGGIDMNGRNGKPLITAEQIELIKSLVKGGESIRQAALRARVSYCTAWRIVNDFHIQGKRILKKEPVRTGYFEHDPYYIF